MDEKQLPHELKVTGKMNGQEFDLHLDFGHIFRMVFSQSAEMDAEIPRCRNLPVLRSNGSTLHALAARSQSGGSNFGFKLTQNEL